MHSPFFFEGGGFTHLGGGLAPPPIPPAVPDARGGIPKGNSRSCFLFALLSVCVVCSCMCVCLRICVSKYFWYCKVSNCGEDLGVLPWNTQVWPPFLFLFLSFVFTSIPYVQFVPYLEDGLSSTIYWLPIFKF